MGMFDDVYYEADLPTGHPESARDFQTKSLFNCLDRLTVTKGGRLILHPAVNQAEGSNQAGPDVDIEFHGDVCLTHLIDGKLVQYVARFTHGTLEWIRPRKELSEIHQWLLR